MRVLTLLVLLLLAACGGDTKPRTQVMLQIDADAAVRAALRGLRVTAHRSDDGGKTWERAFSDVLTEPARPSFQWPARLALVPEEGHEQRRFALEIAALAADDTVLVTQRVVSQFATEKTKLLRVRLDQACAGKVDCAAEDCVGPDCQTCRAGECATVGFLDKLPDFVQGIIDAGGPDAEGGKEEAGVMLPDAGRKDAGAPDAGEPDGNIDLLPNQMGGQGAGQGGAGQSGASGDAVESGSGGGGGEEAPATGFRVESATPAADSSAEPAASIEVSLSAELDPATLDETNFALTRDGQAVPGTFEIAGRNVTFKPQAKLTLAGAYRVELTAQLRDREGRELTPRQWSFRVRDGAWTVTRLNDAETTCDPYVAVARNGAATMVFSETAKEVDAGSAIRVWARRYPLGATAWEAPQQVGMNLGRGGFRCRVAMNNLGYAMAAWDYGDGVLQSNYTTGPNWTPEFLLDGSAYAPQVALTESTRAYVVMQFAHRPSGTIQGFDTSLDQGGWDSYALSEVSFGSVPQLALLDLAAMAVWQQDTQGDAGNPGSRIWARGLGQLWSGAAWADAKLISGTSPSATAPQIASDPAHTTVVAVWQQADATWSHIWASRLVAGGNWSEPSRVSDDTGSASEPVVAVDRAGRARAVWQQTIAGSSRILSAQWIPGQAWSTPSYVSQASSEKCETPVLAVEPGGNALVAWNQVATGGARDLWVGRYVEGSGWQSSKRQQLSAAHAAARPSVGIDDASRGFVTWYETEAAYAARFE